jgi:shikimate kinase
VEALRAHAEDGGFFSYICGTAAVMLESIPSLLQQGGGLQVDNHTTTLPMKKGLSSSAAVCVLIAKVWPVFDVHPMGDSDVLRRLIVFTIYAKRCLT